MKYCGNQTLFFVYSLSSLKVNKKLTAASWVSHAHGLYLSALEGMIKPWRPRMPIVQVGVPKIIAANT